MEYCIYVSGSYSELPVDENFLAQPWMSQYCDHLQFLPNSQSRHPCALFQALCYSLPFLFSLDTLKLAYVLRLSVPGWVAPRQEIVLRTEHKRTRIARPRYLVVTAPNRFATESPNLCFATSSRRKESLSTLCFPDVFADSMRNHCAWIRNNDRLNSQTVILLGSKAFLQDTFLPIDQRYFWQHSSYNLKSSFQ